MRKEIFFTTGTTEFKCLMEKAIELHKFNLYNITLQYPLDIQENGLNTFNFSNKITDYYKESDIVITHAGAGSCYNLLEMGINPIVVPNLERRDKHQKQLAKYLEEKNYCMVCWDIKKLNNCILSYTKTIFDVYEKIPFNKAQEIFTLSK